MIGGTANRARQKMCDALLKYTVGGMADRVPQTLGYPLTVYFRLNEGGGPGIQPHRPFLVADVNFNAHSQPSAFLPSVTRFLVAWLPPRERTIIKVKATKCTRLPEANFSRVRWTAISMSALISTVDR